MTTDNDSESLVENDLRSLPGTVDSDQECPECEGIVVDVDGMSVCSECSIIVGTGLRTKQMSEWEYFFEERPEHWNSEKPRCVGGFPWTYDWFDDDNDS